MTKRTASRLAWSLSAVSATSFVLAGVVDVWKGRIAGWDQAGFIALLTFPLVGGLLAARRPENALGWLLTLTGLSFGIAVSSQSYANYALVTRTGLPFGDVSAWVGTWIWPPGIAVLFVFMLLLFPTGHLPSRRWRPVAWLGGLAVAMSVIPVAVAAWPIRGPILLNIGDDAPEAATSSFKLAFDIQVMAILLTFALGLASAASVVLRFRRSTGEERQQLKWFSFAGAFMVVGFILNSPLFNFGGSVLPVLLIPLLPIAIGIAIFKYRLYDIDLVINKTLVYGALGAFITLVYVGVVVGIGSVFGRGNEPNLGLSILATAVVAVAFQPVRERVQRVANRVVYGKRATPYEVLSHFSERMASTVGTEDLLPRMASILAEGTGAVRTEVWLKVGAALRRAASWPEDGPDAPRVLPLSAGELPLIDDKDRTVPVRHQGELLGALSATKARDDPPTPGDVKLLHDVASQAGLVLRNVKLIEELRASRQRIVAAQDEERRRIERNIHDGAQQQLVALNVKLGLARTLLPRDGEKTQQMIEQLQQETQDALDNLRDLARGIYPPLLQDKGLLPALEGQARKASIPVRVEANGVGRFARDAEAAVYFCVLEALQNVAKYAHASTVVVQASTNDGELSFAVRDDGRGFDPGTTPPGSGLINMRDRIEALGGTLQVRSEPGAGTTVTGRVPIGAEVAA